MRTVSGFDDYELIDADAGERLERWGDIILIRPDPQIIWSGNRSDKRWKSADAIYHRSKSGGGYWETLKKVPDVWSIKYKELTFRLKPMGFKHTGLFPEQAVNWDLAAELIKNADRQLSVFLHTQGEQPQPALRRGRKLPMWTLQRVWCSGQRKMRRQADFPITLCAGLWTIALNL